MATEDIFRTPLTFLYHLLIPIPCRKNGYMQKSAQEEPEETAVELKLEHMLTPLPSRDEQDVLDYQQLANSL